MDYGGVVLGAWGIGSLLSVAAFVALTQHFSVKSRWSALGLLFAVGFPITDLAQGLRRMADLSDALISAGIDVVGGTMGVALGVFIVLQLRARGAGG